MQTETLLVEKHRINDFVDAFHSVDGLDIIKISERYDFKEYLIFTISCEYSSVIFWLGQMFEFWKGKERRP